MELSYNYGSKKFFISDNWFYLLLFLGSFCFFLRMKRKKKRNEKRNMERKPYPFPLNSRGGDNSLILQKLHDQCLSNDVYVEVTHNKVKQIIRKMLNMDPGQTIIISIPVYLLAILKNNYAPLILQRGGTRIVISSFDGFVSRGIGAILLGNLLATGSTALIIAASPLIVTAIIYSRLHLDCNTFVSPLPRIDGNLQYIEAPINKNNKINEDGAVIVAPHTPKPLYYALEETEISTIENFNCYMKGNCLGPEIKERKPITNTLKSKKFIPLSQRTKTLKDLKSQINEIDEIDVNNVNYVQEKKKE